MLLLVIRVQIPSTLRKLRTEVQGPKSNVPTHGPQLLLKYPYHGQTSSVKSPAFARPPPLRLYIDRCIIVKLNNLALTLQSLGLKKQPPASFFLCTCIV